MAKTPVWVLFLISGQDNETWTDTTDYIATPVTHALRNNHLASISSFNYERVWKVTLDNNAILAKLDIKVFGPSSHDKFMHNCVEFIWESGFQA